MVNRIYGNLESRNHGDLETQKYELPEEGMTFDKFKTAFFAWVSGLVLLSGFIYGCCAPSIYTIKTIETVGTYTPKEEVVESLNYPLMWAIWGGTLLLALSFFAVFCVLRNQDKIIEALNKNNK